MDGIRPMLASVGSALNQTNAGPFAIPLAFLLGLLSAVASACCTLPVLSIIVGYAGTRADRGTRAKLYSAGLFVLGAALALVLLGGVAAGIGQVAQRTLGRYWKLFAGVLAVVMGLGALSLLPFNLWGRGRQFQVASPRNGWFGALAFGLVGGGAVSVCSLACNPGIFIIVGAAMLQGLTLWMVGILVAYALGFSLPLGALMLGVSFVTTVGKFQRMELAVRRVAGAMLIAVGFYFLWTF